MLAQPLSSRFTLILLTLLLASCDSTEEPDDDPLPRGARAVAVDVSLADGEEYNTAFTRARDLGADVFMLSIGWEDIETAPGVYAPSFDYLAVANGYYPTRNARIALMIGPIDTNVERLPADLKGRALDDPEVIARFHALLDHVFAKIPDLELDLLAIGNEIDISLGADTDRWEEYRRFHADVAGYARSLRPGLRVGVKMTLNGLTGPMKEYAAAINAASDLILVTHYPLNGDFTVRDPEEIGDDVDKLVAAVDAKPIHFLELGYPSGSANNSSEEKQAEFIRETFLAWDRHAARIPFIAFGIMTDRSRSEVESFGDYYGIDDEKFLEYLRTLGLRTHVGEDKAGWAALTEELEARGW